MDAEEFDDPEAFATWELEPVVVAPITVAIAFATPCDGVLALTLEIKLAFAELELVFAAER